MRKHPADRLEDDTTYEYEQTDDAGRTHGFDAQRLNSADGKSAAFDGPLE
jgi:hypothetical protein